MIEKCSDNSNYKVCKPDRLRRMMATSGYTKFVDFAKLVLVLPNDYFFLEKSKFYSRTIAKV